MRDGLRFNWMFQAERMVWCGNLKGEGQINLVSQGVT